MTDPLGPDPSSNAITQDELQQLKILQVRCMADGNGDGNQERIKEALGGSIGSMAWTERDVDE